MASLSNKFKTSWPLAKSRAVISDEARVHPWRTRSRGTREDRLLRPDQLVIRSIADEQRCGWLNTQLAYGAPIDLGLRFDHTLGE